MVVMIATGKYLVAAPATTTTTAVVLATGMEVDVRVIPTTRTRISNVRFVKDLGILLFVVGRGLTRITLA
jgi:hypothetical protein